MLIIVLISYACCVDPGCANFVSRKSVSLVSLNSKINYTSHFIVAPQVVARRDIVSAMF